MAFLIGGANSAAADTGFTVAISCRWDFGSSPEMNKTLSNGDRQKWTISWWMKLGLPPSGRDYNIFKIWTNSTTKLNCRLVDGGQFSINGEISDSVGFNLITNAVYRDPSAWYNFVFAVDTTQGTAANRMKLYVNGSQVTSFATETYPAEDYNCGINVASDVFYWGVAQNSSNFFDGYFAEVVFIDGTQYAASDFGEYDEDSPTIWKPKDVSALTFGTNGFYLDFEASDNLGNDANGGTDLGETNLAAADQATDSPTNNFCVMNPLDNYFAAGTFSEGNCKVVTNAGNTTWGTSTFGLSAGKWYFEVKFEGTLGGGENAGIIDRPTASTSTNPYNGSGAKNAVWRSGGDLYVNDTNDTDFTPGGGDLWASDDILGVFLDLDNSKIYCAINGSIIISGAGADITAVASTLNRAYFIIAGDSNTASTNFEFNFGGCSAFAISSAVSDSNSIGNFEYSPNQGGAANFDGAAKNFLAICTKNLGSDGG